MADAFPRRFSLRREKRVSVGVGGGGRVKKESQLRLLPHHAVKQFNPESVPVQKRVTMNRLYMSTRHFSINLLTELNDLKAETVDIFPTALLSFTYERDKSHPLPAKRGKNDKSQFYTAVHYHQCLVPGYEQSLSF